MFENKTARIVFYAISAVFLFAADQAAKFFAYRGSFGNFLEALRPAMGKQIFSNYDFAFSLKLPAPLIYLVYVVLISGLLVWFFRTKRGRKENIAFILIVAGALSNIYDRLALGYVRDFIYIFWGNIFNPADLYIISGILTLLFENKKSSDLQGR